MNVLLKSLEDGVNLWNESSICVALPRLSSSLVRLLRGYVLPELGFSREQLRHNFDLCLSTIPITDFIDNGASMVDLFNHPQKYRVKETTLIYYRSVLIRFLDFLRSSLSQMEAEGSFSSSMGEVGDNINSVSASLSVTNTGDNVSVVSPLLAEKVDSGQFSSDNGGAGIKLSLDLISPPLRCELEGLGSFARGEHCSIGERTISNYLSIILYFWGWLHQCRGVVLSQLGLGDMVEFNLLKGFVDWGYTERGNSFGWGMNVISAAIFVARYYQYLGRCGDEEVSVLRQFLADTRKLYLRTSQVKDEGEELTFSQVMEVIDCLRDDCEPRDSSGHYRSFMAIVKSWQRYLITCLLVFTPLRLSDISNLRMDESVECLSLEVFYLRVISGGKRGAVSPGVLRVKIPDFLCSDFAYWLNDLRPSFETDSNFLFIKLGSQSHPESLGKPLLLKDLSRMISVGWNNSTKERFGRVIPMKPQDLGRFQFPQAILSNRTLSAALEEMESVGKDSLRNNLLESMVSQVRQEPDKYKCLGSLGKSLQMMEDSFKGKDKGENS